VTYQLLIKPSARKELEQLSDSILRRIDEAIVKLSNHPRPVGSKKLVGAPLYRIRIGTYRVVYEIDDNRKTVTIVTVGHRGDVYR
jgi:mRNA interferase RelE/StbE